MFCSEPKLKNKPINKRSVEDLITDVYVTAGTINNLEKVTDHLGLEEELALQHVLDDARIKLEAVHDLLFHIQNEAHGDFDEEPTEGTREQLFDVVDNFAFKRIKIEPRKKQRPEIVDLTGEDEPIVFPESSYVTPPKAVQTVFELAPVVDNKWDIWYENQLKSNLNNRR